MDDTFFARRLALLRSRKNVSAREMSLAIGQNESYINRIENGRVYPSMQCFFYICEYLGVSPAEFFYTEEDAPPKLCTALELLQQLDERQLELVIAVAAGLSGRSGQIK